MGRPFQSENKRLSFSSGKFSVIIPLTISFPLFFFCCLSFFFLIFYLLFIYYVYFWLCWVFVSVRGLSPAAASGGHSSPRCAGLSPSRPLPLRSRGSRRSGSAVVAHGPSRSAACGILPDQGPNPCPLHWQADSQPLRHQGSPVVSFFGTLIIQILDFLGWFSDFLNFSLLVRILFVCLYFDFSRALFYFLLVTFLWHSVLVSCIQYFLLLS